MEGAKFEIIHFYFSFLIKKISWFFYANSYKIVELPETVGSQFNKDISSHLGYIKNIIFVMTNLWVVFF